MKPNFYFKTKDNQELAVYIKGDKTKTPVFLLHGGPGGSISLKMFSFLDLTKYYVIGFDQRGCGNSKPFSTLVNNTVFDSVEDIENIRKYLNLDKIILFGGSYGTTLALCYAIKYPENVKTMILRGIFLGRDEDIKWLYQEGASYYFPEAFEKYKNFLNKEEQEDIVQGYYKIFIGNDENLKEKACKIWSDWESSVVRLIPKVLPTTITPRDISLATLECHYFANHMFFKDDNYILNNTDKIKDIPTYIVHGRYDIDCRPIGAFELSQRLNNVNLTFTDAAGHSPYEKTTKRRLKEIFNDLLTTSWY